jgi:hypothetical protein
MNALLKSIIVIAMLLVLGASEASAQYVSRDEAIVRLNNAIQSLSQTQGYPTQVPNSTVTLVLYYKQIIEELSSTSEVGQAIRSAINYFVSGSTPVMTTVAPKNHPVITKNELNGMQTSAIQLLSI